MSSKHHEENVYGLVLDSLIHCILIACLILGEVDVELELSILGPLTLALTQVWTGALLDTVA